jgi:electron transfer flavoprotein beta subunit
LRIVVCIKVMAASMYTMRFDLDTMRVARDGFGVLNPGDRHALEAALQIKEEWLGDVQVSVLALAPAASLPVIREALAIGADRAILIADPAAEGADMLATSRLLACALRPIAPDIVFFGPHGEDSNGGMLCAAVAERLHLPVLTHAAEITVKHASERSSATIKRQTEHGYDVIGAPLPCAIGVAGAINEPRHASLKGKISANSKPVDLLTLADLGLGEEASGAGGSETKVLAIGEPPRRGTTVVFEGDEGAAERIADFLSAKGLL